MITWDNAVARFETLASRWLAGSMSPEVRSELRRSAASQAAADLRVVQEFGTADAVPGLLDFLDDHTYHDEEDW